MPRTYTNRRAEVVCPKCGYHFRLDDKIAAQMHADWERDTIARLRRQESAKARKTVGAEYEQELAERDERIKARDQQLRRVRKQLQDATKGASQESAQELGVIRQETLHELLARSFTKDDFTPIGRGKQGGDLVQLVRDSAGRDCGSILWESKRGYRSFNRKWVAKLKADQKRHGCDVAIIVSDTLPRRESVLCEVEKALACEINVASYVAVLLRQRLIEVASLRRARAGRQDDAKNKVYEYISGPFIDVVRNILQTAIKMREALEKERRAKTVEWRQRELQLQGIVLDLASMYGELQHLGAAFLPVDELEIPDIRRPQLAE